jgi:hypothetical protein
VLRKAVDKIVLAAMCFVGDDDDVAAVGERRVFLPLFSGKNFWMVVKTTPPDDRCRADLRSSRFSACSGV